MALVTNDRADETNGLVLGTSGVADELAWHS